MKKILLTLGLAVTALAQPSITAVQDGAAYTSDIPQGAVFVVKGTNLSGPDYVAATAPTYPTVLNNVRITFTAVSGGTVVNALMVYTYNIGGVNQLAAVLPSTTALGAYDVRVQNGSATSAAFRTNVVARKPGIVTADGSGSGGAQATIGGGLVLVRNSNVGAIGQFTSRPAYPGERIDLWGTGLGADGASDTGGTSGDQTSAGSIRVLVNGVEITPAYSGRSQGFPGLDQTVFFLPQNVTLSCSVPVQIRAGGVLGNMVTIAVAAQGAQQCTNPNPGGGNSTAPTQSEVNGWLNSGNFTYGNVTLGRQTTYSISDSFGVGGATTVTTTMKNASFAGSFARISGADLSRQLNDFVSPTVGQCTVLQSQFVNLYPNLTITSLDAGAALTASGPAGTRTAAKVGSGGFIAYSGDEIPASFLTQGAYTITGPGGPGVPAFSGTLNVGGELIWTNWEDSKVINRSSGTTVRWSGGEGYQYVNIIGSSSDPQNGRFAFFFCLANRSAGQFTIPANILTQVPASPSIGGGGFSFVTRGTLTLSVEGGGTRLNVPGIDYFTLSDDTSVTLTPEYR